MSAELYERFVEINRIDQLIFEAEKEIGEGGQAIPVRKAMDRLNKKYYG